MATKWLTKKELKALGVTLKDSKPMSSGPAGMEIKCHPYLTCDTCGKEWSLPMVILDNPPPDGYWFCPDGCNKPGGWKNRRRSRRKGPAVA
jgi:hypothetical protein